jgi:parallel beta-helix repeat protein
MNTYNCLVNLNGHRHLNGKTLLYMIDGLYPAINQGERVLEWVSFGDDWCSSIFASQDPVAIDSVGLDFLRYEDGMNPSITDVTGNPENYLHEAALADNPPSGTAYDPEDDGTTLASLGVHEHWNNPVEKKYSRNLGTGDGIELVVPSFATEDGPIENVTSGTKYDHIRHAISEAQPGDKIVLSEGIYHENVNFSGKNVILSSIDPGNPAVVAGTVLAGSAVGGGSSGSKSSAVSTGPVVTFASGENQDCMLAGLTISGPAAAVFCSGASPVISDCRIENNGGNGIELREGSNPAITKCQINANAGTGIELQAKQSGRFTIYNYPIITNCIIAANFKSGISGGMPTITNCTIVANTGLGISNLNSTVTNSIIYYNNAGTDSVQIQSNAATVTYSNIQGGWPGQGNIDAVPCFAEPGYWNLGGTLDDVSDDFWVPGDYHLRSQAGRWDAGSQSWLLDVLSSPCIDSGNPDSDFSAEIPPNGDRINIGAYGGTHQASMSFSR